MVMTWFIGMYGITAGFETAVYLRQGTMPEMIEPSGQPDDAREFVRIARLRAIAEARQRTLPLAVGEVLLSLVLVAASVMAMAGRPGGSSFVSQALVANAAFAVVEYALTKSVRAEYIDAVARAGPALFAGRVEPAVPFTPVLWWSERIKLVVFDVGLLGLGLAAVRAKRSQAYFAAASKIEARTPPDDDDDA